MAFTNQLPEKVWRPDFTSYVTIELASQIENVWQTLFCQICYSLIATSDLAPLSGDPFPVAIEVACAR